MIFVSCSKISRSYGLAIFAATLSAVFASFSFAARQTMGVGNVSPDGSKGAVERRRKGHVQAPRHADG
ncbi:hypothetical protein ACC754_40075, partial [Rhizobium johnstonii]